MRKTFAALSCLLIATPVHLAAETVKNPDMFMYATIGDPDSLDPAWSYDTASHNIISNVYEYLLAYKGSGLSIKDLMPMISSKVPSRANRLVSADGLTYRFPIRTGVKFHDGTILTPEDARYSILRFLLVDRDGGPSSLLLEPILGVNSTRKNGKLDAEIVAKAFKAVTVDKGDIVIKLARPFAPFLTIVANFGAMTSQDFCVKNGQWDGKAESLPKFNNPRREMMIPNDKANGTGAFKLERQDKTNKQTVLTRHDGYWRAPARLRQVVIKVVDDFNTRKLMLRAGDADAVYGPQMYFPQLQGVPGAEVIDGLQNLERSSILMFTFKMNPTANQNIGSGALDGQGIPPDFFSDKDVRKAFAYSMDYEGYIRDILRGKGRRTSGVIPASLPGGSNPKPQFSLDPKKAEAHFRKAWGGRVWEKGFKFSFVYNAGSAPAQTIAQMIKKNVEALNPKFKVDLRMIQWSTYLEQTQANKIPMFLAAWQADYPDAHNFAFPIAHSEGYYAGKQGYKNPEVDALINQAALTTSEAKRTALYKKMQSLIDKDVPHVMLAEGVRYRAQRTWVKGFIYRPTFPDMPYGGYYYDLYKAGE
ncbi:MAG: peptide ABC transporter substrate-binding protein [Elusimicrobia bacterium CG11_big_fil_rev_8_21_14_0_20_64_6]|nr:MAG: peptide ABC transporter substrate-binding protein [Elusimicrobia bacterium CG11_big_fil_rev_8_21_14_0_20_64_6]